MGPFKGFLAALVWLTAISLPSTPVAAEDGRLYFLVRHAEKVLQGDDPLLSPAGKLRAAALSSLLADTGIEGIHSTDFNRTRNTVAPLAQRLGLAVELYDPARPENLLADLRKTGGRQLVVGHSNTVPDLVRRLGGDGGPAIDEAREYDRLYLVAVDGNGVVTTVLLRYGTPFNP
ncbi:MAG: phosphoglycerate mutase family protein [Xanthomonadales bacterium]|nr:phosphoglycerate mutase family protein [Xanthomonadales bacterium]